MYTKNTGRRTNRTYASYQQKKKDSCSKALSIIYLFTGSYNSLYINHICSGRSFTCLLYSILTYTTSKYIIDSSQSPVLTSTQSDRPIVTDQVFEVTFYEKMPANGSFFAKSLASSKPPIIATGNHNLGYARQGRKRPCQP